YPFFFSTFFPLKSEFAAHIDLMKKKNIRTIVLIHDVDPFNTLWTNLYAEEARMAGIKVAENYEIQMGDNDFKTILTKAKEHKPEAVVVTIFEIGKVGLVLKTMHELGMNIPLFGSASAQTRTLLYEYGSYAEGNVFTSAPALDSTRYIAFVDSFTRKYGNAPVGVTAANAYDATRAVLETLKEGARSGEEIKQKLNELSLPGTFVDTLDFDEKGQVRDVLFEMKTVKDGTFVEVAS
ncbi:MAG TPA: ABC transporter substrate-binding protein, partial [Candidatus Nanoarchaeia archaeon]|nr:ABC transporter substrate-binding protein [Candidatus Nanoarchaeia archaeon]